MKLLYSCAVAVLLSVHNNLRKENVIKHGHSFVLTLLFEKNCHLKNVLSAWPSTNVELVHTP